MQEPARPVADLRTRDRIARIVLEHGPATASALAGRLGISATAIRRHLDSLVVEGLMEGREERVYGARGRGRPARVFALTDAGRESFPHAYDDLATAALRFLAEAGGPGAVEDFAARRVAVLEERYAGTVAAAADPVRRVAEVLSGEGYAATSSTVSTGGQLCQHHCPVAHVAAEFPQLCEAETKMLGRLLGRHVQRLATIAHGDGVCTTHVPDIAVSPVTAIPVAASGRTDR